MKKTEFKYLAALVFAVISLPLVWYTYTTFSGFVEVAIISTYFGLALLVNRFVFRPIYNKLKD